jgi:hypothetical protein
LNVCIGATIEKAVGTGTIAIVAPQEGEAAAEGEGEGGGLIMRTENAENVDGNSNPEQEEVVPKTIMVVRGEYPPTMIGLRVATVGTALLQDPLVRTATPQVLHRIHSHRPPHL